MKIKWQKIPSVTRQGKWFYRATINGVEIVILQSFLTDLWEARFPTKVSQEYKTAKQAMKFVENSI